MNRFLAKKKGKEDGAPSRPSMDDGPSSFKMFGKSSSGHPDKTPGQGKPEVDLSKALPSSDDFRTSLLMTGLSARFSMLREQDDPTTKVGKASDDSVLFRQTQSKMLEEYEHQEGSRDVSEIESLKNSLFSDFDSLTSEEQASAASSIMNRGKPTDGNNLFGGRQKIYRIPANAGGGGRNGGMSGRALYDDDVALSGFQKWKQAEKEKQLAAEAQAKSAANVESRPSLSRTGTMPSSSTKFSGPTQTSNASPPSLTAQRTKSVKDTQPVPPNQDASAVDRNVTRTKRLYEQGLNQELADQQTSAFSRMDSLSKVRAFTPLTPDMQSPVTGTFGDRRQVFAQASAPNLRAFTPSASADLKSGGGGGGGANPPLSPPISESGSQTPLQRQQSSASSANASRGIPLDNSANSFFNENEVNSLLSQIPGPNQTPSLSIERPDDEDHPAFRRAAPPTPSSLAKVDEDAPALGPNTGLSSMVRAHLRSESAASSVYDNNEEVQADQNGSAREVSPASGKQTASQSPPGADEEANKEQDEFARHLADGARRVREKLTSYVDADPDRAIPLPSSPVEPPKDLNPPRPSLGLLRSKSSRGSLFDRENRDLGRSLRAGISAANISAALPSPRRLPTEFEEARGRTAQVDDESADNVPIGLKAFRQARRELQKVKEVDSPQKTPSGPARPLALRAMSYEPSASSPSPSVSVFNRMPRGESRSGMGSRSGSRAPSERDRSGSDTSNSGLPPRIRNGSVAQDDRLPGSPSSSTRRPPPTSNSTIECRPRTGSKGGAAAAAAAANSYASMQAGVPPLPPLNPRRVNGLRGEDDSPVASPRMPGGFPLGDEASDDDAGSEQRHQRLRRATSEGNSLHGRARTSPPRNEVPPPLPQGGLPNGKFAGGMI